MTLTTRITNFFLGVLACVLVGFAVGLYLLADRYLHNGLAERLESALNTLVAAADVNPDSVEWEPASRTLTIGQDPSPDQVRWCVRDEQGKDIDRSRNMSPEESISFLQVSPNVEHGTHEQALNAPDRPGWRLLHKRIAATGGAEKTTSQLGANNYRVLTITVGVSLVPVESTLRTLALALAGLTIALWSIAAVSGRWICRRALSPVIRMADAARDMTADDWHARLPMAATSDELEELARTFNGLLSRLAESFERQRRFTGDASHQLRTPVTAMLGQIDVTMLRDRPLEEYRRALDAIRAQAQRLRQIVDSQLFLARADAESFEPALEEMNLAGWLHEHLRAWRDHPRWHDFQFESTPDERVIVRGHRELLAQLFDNLLDNAVKYSPAGTPIQVGLAVSDNSVECSVANDGQPIAPDDLSHLFEPFFRSADARRLGIAGAGLGLAIAQRIATAFGGAIRAEPIDEGGMRFVLQLPRIETAASNKFAAGEPSFQTAANSGRR